MTTLAAAAGCTASADQVHPLGNTLFYPSGLALAPDQSALFVANANSELRYDSGAISVLPLDRVDAKLTAWLASPPSYMGMGDCAPATDHSETLVCDEAEFMDDKAGVRVGNFATDIAVQDFGASGARVFVPTRGDPSVAYADYTDGKLHCTDKQSEEFPLCDDAHRLAHLQNDPDLPTIPDEPFGVFADGPNGFAVVTHLSSGAVTLIHAPQGDPRDPTHEDVRVVDLRANFFAPDAATGLVGATGVVGRTPGQKVTTDGAASDIIYVGSRTDHRIQTFTLGQLPLVGPDGMPAKNPDAAYLLPSNFFLLTSVGNVNGSGSTDTRGMHFSKDGNRLYLVNRSPPSLQIYDTSLTPSGVPRNTALGAIDICRQASTVTLVEYGTAGAVTGERAYVSCFQDGQVYVIDPAHLDAPEDIVLVGRGPYSVVASDRGARKLLFVSNVLEDTVAVVDVTPGSATYNRVVLRIGKPRTP